MVRVILNATDKYNPYDKAEIKRVDYNQSNLFYKYTHDPLIKLIAEDIKVFKERKTIWQWYGYYIILKVRHEYKENELKMAEVYFNTFDTKNVPILLVLFFRSDESTSRYYSLINIDKEVQNYTSKFIDELPVFQDYNSLYSVLVSENDRLNHFLTFDLNKIMYVIYYNNRKIHVHHKVTIRPDPNNNSHYFSKYQHIPTHGHKGKNGCIVFNFQAPLTRDKGRSVILQEIQNVALRTLGVYWSNIIDIPLMFELDYESHPNYFGEHSYYITKKDQHGIYFEKLQSSSREFKDLIKTVSTSVHDALNDDEGTFLKSFLLKLERNLYKSLYLVLFKKAGYYSYNDISNALTESKIDFGSERIVNKDNNVKVDDKTNQKEGECLSTSPFKVMEHDFSECVKSINKDELLKIKFVLTNTHLVPPGDLLVLDASKTDTVRPYNGGKYYIQITPSSLGTTNYLYYTHSGNYSQPITKGPFIITHNGMSVQFNGDFGDDISGNQNIRFFYEKYTTDKFLMILFLLKDTNNVSYLTYLSFMEATLTNSTISLSSLPKFTTKHHKETELDQNLMKLLDEEFQKMYNLNKNDMLTFDYSFRKTKLYTFYHEKSHFPLLVFYKDTTYRPISKDKYFDKWEKVEIQNCPCDNKIISVVNTRKPPPTLLEALQQIARNLGLMEPQQHIHQRPSSKAQGMRQPTRQKTFEPERREAVIHEQRKSENPIVDISLLGPKDYDSHRMSVSDKNVHPDSDLFCFYRHTLKNGNALSISSIIFANAPKKKVVDIKENIIFESLDVYFNVQILERPVILVFNSFSGTRYFIVSVTSDQNYTIKEDLSVSFDLTSKLIDESDRINNTITYQLDITETSDMKYGISKSISINKQANVGGQGFSIFTHSSSKSNRGYVLFNKALFTPRTPNQQPLINDIQNKSYKVIKVYCLDSNINFPLIVEFSHSSSSIIYFLRKDQSGFYWFKEEMNLSNNATVRTKLNELHYFLGDSIIIEIEKGGGSLQSGVSGYPMKIIENTLQSNTPNYLKTRYADAITVEPKLTISVTGPSNLQDLPKPQDNPFKFFKHKIPKPSAFTQGDKIFHPSGIRLFISNSIDSYRSELFFYKKTDKAPEQNDRLYLNYPLDQNNLDELYVFFFSNDPRPVLLCYNQQVFVRYNSNDTTKWILERTVTYSKLSELSSLLKTTHSTMKRKLTFLKSGKEENINITESSLENGFKRKKYIASPHHTSNLGPFRLPMTSILTELSDISIISKLLERFDSKTLDSVSFYYKDVINNIFLFEFTEESKKTYFQKGDSGTKYWIEKDISFDNDKELSDYLIKTKSQVDNTLIYDIHKIVDGYNSNIKLTKTPNDPETGFTKYRHSPKDNRPRISVILFKDKKLVKKYNDILVPIDEIENQSYRDVTVYFGTKTKDDKTDSILIVGLNSAKSYGTNITYYCHKRQDSESYWEHLDIPHPDFFNRALIHKLKDTELDLMESVVVLLEKRQHELKYGEPEVKEAVDKLSPRKAINIQKMDERCMAVKDITNGSHAMCLRGTGYKVFEHYVHPCVGSAKICGLRFFVLSTTGKNYSDITLYNNVKSIDTLYLERPIPTDKVYVYFYGGVAFKGYHNHFDGDPRPLLIYYGKNAYRPQKVENTYLTDQVSVDFTKWVKVPEIRECNSSLSLDPFKSPTNEPLLNTLVETSGYLNTVELNPQKILGLSGFIGASAIDSNSTTYFLHKYANYEFRISITSENLNCYRKYKYHPHEMTDFGSYHRLGSLLYTDSKGYSYAIDYTDSDYKYLSLMQVSVFYHLFDVNHNYPLLIMLVFKDINFKSYVECYQLISRPGLKDKPDATLKWQKIKHDGDDKGFLKDLRLLYHESEPKEEFFTSSQQPSYLDVINYSYQDSQVATDKLHYHIESHLYSIKTKLNIDFTDEEKKFYLFDPKNCSEGNITAAVVGGSVGGVVGTAAVGGGVTLAVRPELIVTSIKALI